jgi:hypothetical protein
VVGVSAQVAADLRAAAEVLRRSGWAQGGLAKHGFCAIEAIWQARSQIGGWESQARVEQLRTIIPAPHSIVDWNDAPGRTADEVIAALEAAADAAEAGQ